MKRGNRILEIPCYNEGKDGITEAG